MSSTYTHDFKERVSVNERQLVNALAPACHTLGRRLYVYVDPFAGKLLVTDTEHSAEVGEHVLTMWPSKTVREGGEAK